METNRNISPIDIKDFTRILDVLHIDSPNILDQIQDYVSKSTLGQDVSNHYLTKVYLPIIDYNKRAGRIVDKISLDVLINPIQENPKPSGSGSGSGS